MADDIFKEKRKRAKVSENFKQKVNEKTLFESNTTNFEEKNLDMESYFIEKIGVYMKDFTEERAALEESIKGLKRELEAERKQKVKSVNNKGKLLNDKAKLANDKGKLANDKDGLELANDKDGLELANDKDGLELVNDNVKLVNDNDLHKSDFLKSEILKSGNEEVINMLQIELEESRNSQLDLLVKMRAMANKVKEQEIKIVFYKSKIKSSEND